MNIGKFMGQHRSAVLLDAAVRVTQGVDSLAAVFSNTEYMIAEMASAADTIRALTGEIDAARRLRQIEPMREATAELMRQLAQLKIMAESLQKVAER